MYILAKSVIWWLFVLSIGVAIVPSVLDFSVPNGFRNVMAPVTIVLGPFFAYFQIRKVAKPYFPENTPIWKVALYGFICGGAAGAVGGLSYGYSVDPDLFWTAFVRVIVASTSIGIATSVLTVMFIHTASPEFPSHKQSRQQEDLFGITAFSILVAASSVYVLMQIGYIGAKIVDHTGMELLNYIGRGNCETNKPYLSPSGGAVCDVGDISIVDISLILSIFLLVFMPFVGSIFEIRRNYWRGMGLFLFGTIIWLGVMTLVQILFDSFGPQREYFENNPFWIAALPIPALLLLGWFIFTVFQIKRNE